MCYRFFVFVNVFCTLMKKKHVAKMTVHSVNSVKSLMFIIFSVAEYKYQIRLILDKINRNLAVIVAFCYFEYTMTD